MALALSKQDNIKQKLFNLIINLNRLVSDAEIQKGKLIVITTPAQHW